VITCDHIGKLFPIHEALHLPASEAEGAPRGDRGGSGTRARAVARRLPAPSHVACPPYAPPDMWPAESCGVNDGTLLG
jgi:hypothetical protein